MPHPLCKVFRWVAMIVDGSGIRTAIVGCGRVSRTAHYSALKTLPAFDFRAVCDIDRERAEAAGLANNVTAYHGIQEMLEREPLDLVSICAPNGLHARLAAAVVERGIHVLVEKPLGMSVEEADALIDLCEARRVRLFCVLQNRFNPTVQLVRRAVEKGRFGRLLSAAVTLRWKRSLPYYTEDQGWRGQRDMAGGVFTNQAIHHIDTLQWMVGAPPDIVFARMATAMVPVDVETHGCAVVTFRNGVIASLNLTCLSYPDDREGSVALLGEKGTVKIGGSSLNRILEWEFADPDPEDDALARQADYEPPTVYGNGHEEMYRRVGCVLRGEADPAIAPDGREGRKAVALLEGLYRSDRLGEPVRFPLGRR